MQICKAIFVVLAIYPENCRSDNVPGVRSRRRSPNVRTLDEWEPAEGGDKWKETDFESELDKLEKEAEERLDAKIAELQGTIDSVGKP